MMNPSKNACTITLLTIAIVPIFFSRFSVGADHRYVVVLSIILFIGLSVAPTRDKSDAVLMHNNLDGAYGDMNCPYSAPVAFFRVLASPSSVALHPYSRLADRKDRCVRCSRFCRIYHLEMTVAGRRTTTPPPEDRARIGAVLGQHSPLASRRSRSTKAPHCTTLTIRRPSPAGGAGNLSATCEERPSVGTDDDEWGVGREEEEESAMRYSHLWNFPGPTSLTHQCCSRYTRVIRIRHFTGVLTS
jgi:hypothetical protein